MQAHCPPLALFQYLLTQPSQTLQGTPVQLFSAVAAKQFPCLLVGSLGIIPWLGLLSQLHRVYILCQEELVCWKYCVSILFLIQIPQVHWWNNWCFCINLAFCKHLYSHIGSRSFTVELFRFSTYMSHHFQTKTVLFFLSNLYIFYFLFLS